MKTEKYIEQLYSYIDAHESDMIRELSDLASIRSVSDSTSEIKPFGQGCIDVLECMLEKGSQADFITRNSSFLEQSKQLVILKGHG